MSAKATRPRGVLGVFVLLLVAGVLGLIGGIGGLLGGAAASESGSDDSVALGSGMVAVSVVSLVLAVLNIILSFGVLRGSRVARMIVTILQVLSLAAGAYSMFSTGSFAWSGIVVVLLPIVILILLWGSEDVRRFFNES